LKYKKITSKEKVKSQDDEEIECSMNILLKINNQRQKD
jgi:hypothetical protein